MRHLFQEGFENYLESGDFSDITLKTQNRTYKVHRLLLAYRSDFFAALLTSGFKEGDSDVIELKFNDSEDLFPEVIKFMYTDRITITDTNAIPLLALADHYLIESLRQKASDFICEKVIHRSNVIDILKHSLDFNVQDIIDKCICIVAKNFCRFQDTTDWNFLPPDVFCRLLREEYLTIKDEYSFYLLIRSYIDFHNDELNDEQITDLMRCVRFRWMTFEQLEAIEKDARVPSRLFIEALKAKLLHYENPNRLKEEEFRDARFKPRASFGMQFEYSHDGDENGIIYWIATNCGKEPYINPHQSGRVIVTSSSLYRGHESYLVSQAPGELWTEDVPASWFCIDLGENRAVLPTHYTLRHGGNYRSDFLRTWDFQGSNDGREWTLLRKHTNDLSFTDAFQTCSWSIEADKAYQKFRVLQTGHSSRGRNYLLLSGIELYGELYEYNQRDEPVVHYNQ